MKAPAASLSHSRPLAAQPSRARKLAALYSVRVVVRWLQVSRLAASGPAKSITRYTPYVARSHHHYNHLGGFPCLDGALSVRRSIPAAQAGRIHARGQGIRPDNLGCHRTAIDGDHFSSLPATAVVVSCCLAWVRYTSCVFVGGIRLSNRDVVLCTFPSIGTRSRQEPVSELFGIKEQCCPMAKTGSPKRQCVHPECGPLSYGMRGIRRRTCDSRICTDLIDTPS